MDYKELLIKYIRHVGHESGSDYIYHMDRYPETWSAEEIGEMDKLSAEG